MLEVFKTKNRKKNCLTSICLNKCGRANAGYFRIKIPMFPEFGHSDRFYFVLFFSVCDDGLVR